MAEKKDQDPYSGIPHNGHTFFNPDRIPELSSQTSPSWWLIICARTGGTFSTAIWGRKGYPKNICPACGKDVD